MKTLFLPLNNHTHFLVSCTAEEPYLSPGAIVQVEVLTGSKRFSVDGTWLELVISSLAHALDELLAGNRAIGAAQAEQLGYWHNVELYNLHSGESIPDLSLPSYHTADWSTRYSLFGGSPCASWLYTQSDKHFLQLSPYFPQLENVATNDAAAASLSRWLTTYQPLLTVELDLVCIQQVHTQCLHWQKGIIDYHNHVGENPFAAQV